jgi:glycine/D-amino acid oxidase-like deaminating enzyme
MAVQNPFQGKDVLLWNTAAPYLYTRGTPDGRVIAGGRDERFFSPAKRDKLIARKSRQLVNDYKRLFPDRPFKSEFSWTGTFGSTKDGLPFIGSFGNISQRYFALGFGGNGITFSVIAAEIIRDLILGKKAENAELYAFDRA